MSREISEYKKDYSEDSFWEKVSGFAKKAGIKVIYVALLLFYVLQNPQLPVLVKAKILAALGYFISPIDLVPDIVPVAGYLDDFGILLAALAISSMYIDEAVKEKARKKLKDWFGDYNTGELIEVDVVVEKEIVE